MGWGFHAKGRAGGKGEDQKVTKEEAGTSEVMKSELRCQLRGTTRSRGVCLFGASSAS